MLDNPGGPVRPSVDSLYTDASGNPAGLSPDVQPPQPAQPQPQPGPQPGPTGPQPNTVHPELDFTGELGFTEQPGVNTDFGQPTGPGFEQPTEPIKPQVKPMDENPAHEAEREFKQTALYIGLGAGAVLIPIFLLICTCLVAISSADQQDPSKAQSYQEFDHEDYLHGKPCKEGYDSHYVLVDDKCNLPISYFIQ